MGKGGFPYNRSRPLWRDLRDQQAKSFTVFFFLKNFMQKRQYIGAVLAEASPVGFPTIYSPRAALLGNLSGSTV